MITLVRDWPITTFILTLARPGLPTTRCWTTTTTTTTITMLCASTMSAIRRRSIDVGQRVKRGLMTDNSFFKISPEVRDAVMGGQPVVALETTIYTHGKRRITMQRISLRPSQGFPIQRISLYSTILSRQSEPMEQYQQLSGS